MAQTPGGGASGRAPSPTTGSDPGATPIGTTKTPIVSAGGRPGANCTLSYPRDGKTYAYRVRVGRLTHGLMLIADEAQGRIRRSFYPHRLSNAQFSLGLILDGTRQNTYGGTRWNEKPTEYEKFMSWLFDYMNYMLIQDDQSDSLLPVMKVSVASHNFCREGIPLGPVLFGDHMGSMIWTPTLVFETTRDYLEPARVQESRFIGGLTDLDKNAAFFYPTGPQLLGDETPLIFDQEYDQGTAGANPAGGLPNADAVAAAARGDN